MHKDTLPLKVDPFRFADNAISLQSTLPIKNMQRLCESLGNNEGDVQIDIHFGADEEGIRFVRGHIDTTVSLQCQRCLESFTFEIASDFASGIVHTDEEGDKLPQRYDPLVAKDATLFISDLIEEELIVSLPIVPMHDVQTCKVKLPFLPDNTVSEEPGPESPFKVIEILRSKRK